MMLLIHWIIILPKKINIGLSFILGIIMDCIFGYTLGMHALSFSILSYLTVRKIYFFRCLSAWQQSFFILFFSLINQIIKFLTKFVIAKILCSTEIFLICIIDAVIWPFLILLMYKIYRH